MNPIALPMMPMVANNPAKQSNNSVSNITEKFGDVLGSTLSKNVEVTELNSIKTDLTAEQKKVIEDLLAFLGVNRLSDLEDGTLISEKLLNNGDFGDSDSLLQLLKNLNGKDESVVAELIANIGHLNKGSEGNETDDAAALFSEISSSEIQNPLDFPNEIYALLQKLDSLDIKDWSKLDVKAAGNLLKLAKLQDLLSTQKDMTKDAALLQKEIKNLLDSISGKLEKWVGNQPSKLGNEATFAVILENGSNKSLDVVKQVYQRMLTSDGETTDDAVSNGLSLKTSETNTQSSGLPFQMTKLEQYVLTASKNGQAVDSEHFVKSFENIISKANFSNTNGVQKLLIRLNPENLGSLRIELVQKDGIMVAKILATTAQAKELLDHQVQGLKQAFTNQHIQVEKIEIAQQISTFNPERFAPRDQGQQGQHKQQQSVQEAIEDEETDFNESFVEALLNLEV